MLSSEEPFAKIAAVGRAIGARIENVFVFLIPLEKQLRIPLDSSMIDSDGEIVREQKAAKGNNVGRVFLWRSQSNTLMAAAGRDRQQVVASVVYRPSSSFIV